MCNFSGKLIAWMDGELPESDAAEVKRHVAACGECRERLAAYRQASGAFDAYCEAFVAAETKTQRRRTPRWVLAACGAGAIAAAAMAAILMLPRGRVAQTPAAVAGRAATLHAAEQQKNESQGNNAPPAALGGPAAAVDPIDPAQPAANGTVKVRHRNVAPASRTENAGNVTAAAKPRAVAAPGASAFQAEPPIEIAIPADAMFPPGAVPPGVSFTADLTIAPDGSAERLGLRPRLAGFERRGNQP